MTEIEWVYSRKEWDYYINGTLQRRKMSESDISITVKFFASLREYGPIKEVIDVKENDTIKTLLDKYKIPEVMRKIIVLVNTLPTWDQNYILKTYSFDAHVYWKKV